MLCDKLFEADVLMTVLSGRHAKPAFFPLEPTPGTDRGHRASFVTDDVRIEIHCLEELVEGDNRLLSRARVQPLQTLLWPEWDVVVSFATGGSPWPQRYAGSVVVGSAVMNHSPSFVARQKGDVEIDLDQIVASPAAAPLFRAFGTKRTLDFERLVSARAPLGDKLKLVKRLLEGEVGGEGDMPPWSRGLVWELVQRAEIEMKFTRPPQRHERPVLLFGKDWVSATTLNVARLEDLPRAEQEALDEARHVCATRRTLHEGSPPTPFAVASLDTCHGLVRTYCGSAPFLFITGLTDRPYAPLPDKKREADNYGAAFNAGVVAVYLIERLVSNPSILTPPDDDTAPKRRRFD